MSVHTALRLLAAAHDECVSGQQMAHGNGYAVLAGAKLHGIAGTQGSSLPILVTGRLSVIEHHIVH